jgi:DNA-binding NarL/FixJ family response regulator
VIRVLIVDDEPLIRAGVRAVLDSAPEVTVVGEAANGRAAVDGAVRHRADVALLDIRMPVLDGLAAMEELARRLPGLRVVLLTAFGVEPNLVRAVRGGAAGFVLKNCTPGELIGAVRAAHAGDAWLSPPITRMLMGLVTPDSTDRRRQAARRLGALSGREAEIAALVGEGLTNAEIGARLHMSEATIKTYLSRVLTKLDCANRVQAALLVRDASPS